MNLKELAEDFQIAGLNPIPVLSNKAPYLPKGHNYLYEDFNDLETFNDSKVAMVGIAGGKVSSNICCIDFDAHDGQPIHDIIKQFGDTDMFRYLIKTKKISVETTPSGGYHVIFLAHEPIKCQALGYWKLEKGAINAKKMIETKGEGGYFITAPNKNYKHIRGADVFNLVPLIEEEVNFLLNHARSFNQHFKTENNNRIKKEWPEKWDNETPDGRYNNENIDNVIDLLFEAGWQEVENNNLKNEKKGKYLLVRPGKDVKDGISATYNHLPGMFYVFTDADSKFEQNKAYSPFNILTILKFNGDWKKAKDYCAELYDMPVFSYNTQIKKEIVPEPESFPLDVLPLDWQSYINESQLALNYNPDFMACSMISAMASVVGNNCKAKVKNSWMTPPIFWFAAVAGKGSMKSPPIKSCLKPLEDIDNKSFTDYQIKLGEYELLEDKEKKQQKRPVFKQIIIKDATLEAIIQVLGYNQNGLLMYKDELVGFIKSMNQYRKGADEEFWLESFGNGQATVNRVTKDPILVKNIFINIIGTIQDSVLADLAKSHSDNGFLDRFLFTKPNKKITRLSLQDLSEEAIQWWKRYILNIHNDFSSLLEPLVLEFNKDALNGFLEYDEKLCKLEESDSIESSVKGYASKLRTMFPRFSLMFCLMDYYENAVDLVIDGEHVKKSMKVCDYFFSTARKIFVEQQENNELSEFISTLKGKTSTEKIIETHKKYPEMKQKLIADYFKVTPAYVSNCLKSIKKVNKINKS